MQLQTVYVIQIVDEWINNQQKYVGCTLANLIWISDQDRSNFTILAPQLSASLSTKCFCLSLALPLLCLFKYSSAGEKKNPPTCVHVKGFVSCLQWPFCMEFFTPSALKCQHFPFLEMVSSKEHFAKLHIRMLHKIKWYCLSPLFVFSPGQVILWLWTRQLHENLVLTVQCYFFIIGRIIGSTLCQMPFLYHTLLTFCLYKISEV